MLFVGGGNSPVVSGPILHIVSFSEEFLGHLKHMSVLFGEVWLVGLRRVELLETAQISYFVLISNLVEFEAETFFQVNRYAKELA